MISRRNFLKAVAVGIAAVHPLKNALASQKTAPEKTLNMYNTHTGESINIRYYDSGIYDSDALDRINHFLRCHYTNEVRTIDVRLLDLLYDIQNIFGKGKQIKIISGYRSFEYNEYLRSLGRRVSKNSLHLYGLAVDFEMQGVSNYNLYRIAKSFGAGGVGYYPEFVHIDTGRIRYW